MYDALNSCAVIIITIAVLISEFGYFREGGGGPENQRKTFPANG